MTGRVWSWHGLEACKEIDERVAEFLQRPLTGAWPYLWLDATYLRSARAAGSYR